MQLYKTCMSNGLIFTRILRIRILTSSSNLVVNFIKEYDISPEKTFFNRKKVLLFSLLLHENMRPGPSCSKLTMSLVSESLKL